MMNQPQGPESEPSSDADATIRDCAIQLLGDSFRNLAAAGVIPRRRATPWMHSVTDYDLWVVPDGLLEKVLVEQMPERFGQDVPPAWDSPWHYGYRLVEAAVAMATSREQPYSTDAPFVRELVDDFLVQLQRPMEARVALVVSDVRLPDKAPVEIDGVIVQAAHGGAEGVLERILPRTGQLIDRMDAIALSRGHDDIDTTAVIHAAASGYREHRELSVDARRMTRELLSAIRLVTGSTTVVLADVEGQPSRVHPHGQWVHSQPHRTELGAIGSRLATLDPTMVPLLTKVVHRLRRPGPEEGTSMHVALGRFNRVLNEPTRSLSDTVIDLLIGLEAAMTTSGREEVSLRVRMHSALLLSSDSDPGATIYEDIKSAYNLRSIVAHGGALTAATIRRELNRVSATMRAGDLLGYRVTLAVDRWRDLLRRAILLRLALSDVPGTWPEVPGEGWDVDKQLSAGVADAWKAACSSYWGDPRAAGPVTPLAGLIGVS